MKPFREYRVLKLSSVHYFAQVRDISGGIRIGSIKLFASKGKWDDIGNSFKAYDDAFEVCFEHEKKYMDNPSSVVGAFDSYYLQLLIRFEGKQRMVRFEDKPKFEDKPEIDSEHWNAIPYE